MPAQYVKRYVKTNRNDYLDAEALAKAVQRPTMRFVPIKAMSSWICRHSIVYGIAGWLGVLPCPLVSTALTAAGW